MEKLHIDCAGGNYDIIISPGSWSEAAQAPGRKMLVCDSNVAELYRERAEKLFCPAATFVFPAGEEHKIRTLAGKRFRHLETESGRGAGDDCHAACKIKVILHSVIKR